MAKQGVKILVAADVHNEQPATTTSTLAEKGANILVSADVYNKQSATATLALAEQSITILASALVHNEQSITATPRREPAEDSRSSLVFPDTINKGLGLSST